MVSVGQFSRETSKCCMGNAWQVYVCPYSCTSVRDVNLEDAKSTYSFMVGQPQAGDSHITIFTLFFSKQRLQKCSSRVAPSCTQETQRGHSSQWEARSYSSFVQGLAGQRVICW